MQINSINDLINEHFGVECEAIEEASTLDADIAVKALVGRNARRVALLIINLSANNVTVAPFKDVSLTRGIRIASGGGSVAMNWRDDLLLPAMEWSAVADVDNSGIYVLGMYISAGRPGEAVAA